MNIIEEVKKMDKIPFELIEALADKIGTPGWREEGEERGVNILIMDREETRNAFSGSPVHLVQAFEAAKSSLDQDPRAKALLEIRAILDGIEEEEEEMLN